MHLFKVTVFGGLAATAALAETESMCGGASTVYITVTAPQVTKTIFTTTVAPSSPLELGASSSMAELNTESLAETSLDLTATSTTFETITHVVSLLTATAMPVKTDQGPYSFAEHSGTTIWLGSKTPPTSESIVYMTKAITVEPVPTVPTSTDVSGAAARTTTSFSTLSLTTVTSETFTETVTESSSSPVASAKPFTGVATYGWNSTLTTLLRVQVGAKGSGRVQPTGIAPESPVGTEHGRPSPYATGGSSESLAARQVGSIVVATIEGIVVSWTNSYDGQPVTTATPVAQSSFSVVEATAPTTPTTTLAAYPWELSTFSNLMQSTKPAVPQASALSESSSTVDEQAPTSTIELISASAIPSTTLAVYPWDLSPSSSSVQVATKPAVPTVSTSATMTPVPTKSSSIPSSDTQPGFSTMQPTSIASLLSHVSHGPSTTITLSMNTSSASITTATPTSTCIDVARFTIGFDDLPHFSTGAGNVDIPPIFNPYRKLYWEQHFGYVPPPTDPFPPISPPQLAVYRVDNNTNVDGSPDAGDESIGEFGAGPRSSESAYWIDAYSAYLGCSNAGPGDCTITINGYDAVASTRAVYQTVTQPPCPGLKNCTLALVEFSAGFRNLSGIQILAVANDRLVTWYMDDLQLGWSNNTCAAATERASAE